MADTATEPEQQGHLERLTEALESGRMAPVRRMVNSLNAAEIGELLESLPLAKRQLVWNLVDSEYDGEVLVHVNDEVRASLIKDMDPQELVAATGNLDIDDLADIIEDLPETVVQEVLHAMDVENRARLEQVLTYPEDSAGGLMDPATVTVRTDVTVEVVLRYLRARGELPAGTDTLYVVDRQRRYIGWVALTTLLTCDPAKTVKELVDTREAAIPADTPASEVAKIFENRDLLSAPVVDEDNRLLGRITIDDVVDVIREEAEHSVLSMAGLDEDVDMFAPVMPSVGRRAVWLGVNLCTAFLAAWVIGQFQGALEQIVALAVLMPVVASMGGVAGTQTMTLMVRGMALGQVGAGNAQALLSKEIAVGVVNGVLFAVVIGAIAGLWFQEWNIALVMGAAVVINLLAAALAGVIIPLFLRWLKIDPALASGVVLIAVTDTMGFLAFLGLATWYLL